MAACVSLTNVTPCASTAIVCTPSAAARSTTISAGASFRPSLWRRRQDLSAKFVSRPTHSVVRRAFTVFALSDFAVQESSKFHGDLLIQLGDNPVTADNKDKIAEVCTKIFGSFCEKYDGTLIPEPFEQMKTALMGENLAGPDVAVRAALGWSRGYLYHDWKTWNTEKEKSVA